VVCCQRFALCGGLIIALLDAPLRAAPTAVGAQIAGTFPDASGHSAQSHLVYAANSGVWWLFTLTSAADSTGGSNHLVKAYRSSGADLATAVWTAAGDSPGASTSASSNCVSCVMGSGRALGVAYVNAGGRDVIHAEVAMAADGQNGLTAHIRATLSATAIAWETWNYHDEGAATWTLPRAVSLGVSTGGYIHSAGPTLQQEVDANIRRSVNPDLAATWTSGSGAVAVVDNSMVHENNALAFAPLANDVMLAVYDNGGGTEPMLTNLRYARSNVDGSWTGVPVGSQSGGDGAVFGTNATIDQNDWALVSVTTADVYAFRRNAAGSGIDAAVYAPATNTWAALAPPPPFGAGQGFKSGAGLFGATDGASVWLFVLNTDAASTVLFTRRDDTGWTSWSSLPGTDAGTHDRRFISGYPRVSANQIGLVWTEGAGLYDVVVTSAVAADTVAPQVQVTAPAGGSTVFGPVPVQATASDNVAVASVTFQIDGVSQGAPQTASPFGFTWDSTKVANGTHAIGALAADAAGNTSTATVSVTVSNTPDTTPPTISSVTAFAIAPTAASISWTTDERATSVVDYGQTTNYGASVSNGALATAHTMALSGLTPATTYHFRVSSADGAGNASSSADSTLTTTTADTAPPMVAMTAPANGGSVSGTVTVSASATDNTAVAGVQFLLDGTNLGAEVAAAPYTISWTTTAVANGTHTLAARARDAAGNVATSSSVTVTVTNVAAPLIDVVVSADQASSRALRMARFSTATTNELLLAFVSAGDVSAGNTVTAVTGAGLTWTLVRRTNAQRGTSEVWRAFAATRLNNVLVTVQIAQPSPVTATLVSLSRVDTTGTDGSGAIGATASGSAGSGAPTASLVTTRNSSLVLGVGDDWSAAASRSVGSGQTLLHQFLSGGRTLWVQRAANPIDFGGTTVVINDTSPTTDRFNLTICEVLGKLQ